MTGGTTIELRAPAARDRAEFTAAMRSSRPLHHPWLAAPVSDEAFAGLLRRNRDDRFVTLLACRRADGAIVGYFNISEIVRGPFQSAYLSYAAVSLHARQGYMTQGLELVLRHAFTQLGLHRLEANIQPANAASIALVARCRFAREGLSERYLKVGGRWRDHERWAIRSEQWRARGATRAPASRGAS
jgi:ribosomal-protein-alanine N-acetyltransferase